MQRLQTTCRKESQSCVTARYMRETKGSDKRKKNTATRSMIMRMKQMNIATKYCKCTKKKKKNAKIARQYFKLICYCKVVGFHGIDESTDFPSSFRRRRFSLITSRVRHVTVLKWNCAEWRLSSAWCVSVIVDSRPLLAAGSRARARARAREEKEMSVVSEMLQKWSQRFPAYSSRRNILLYLTYCILLWSYVVLKLCTIWLKTFKILSSVTQFCVLLCYSFRFRYWFGFCYPFWTRFVYVTHLAFVTHSDLDARLKKDYLSKCKRMYDGNVKP
jgi:hypothetical protein